jgi:hypothetical protein
VIRRSSDWAIIAGVALKSGEAILAETPGKRVDAPEVVIHLIRLDAWDVIRKQRFAIAQTGQRDDPGPEIAEDWANFG